MKLSDVANLPGGIHDYLLPAPHYFAHFPFLSASAATFGVLTWAPFALAALAFPLTWLDATKRDRAWVLAGGFLLAGCLLNFGTVCAITFRNDRYAIDFLPAAIWLAACVMGAALTARRRRWRLAGMGLAAAAVFTLIHSLLLGLSGRPYPILARVLDYPVALVERLAGARYGPLQLELRFPDQPVLGRSEPLVAMADGTDVLYATQPDARHVQFRFFHRGVGGPATDPLPLAADRSAAVELDLGAFYPSAEDPLFAGWPPDLVDALHRRLRIRFGGRTVLDRAVDFYANDFFHTAVGVKAGPRPGTRASRERFSRCGAVPFPAPRRWRRFPSRDRCD